QDFTFLFNYFIDSDSFTSEFLVEFLNSFYQHAERVREKYSAQGNHLLFEAQRMIYGGGFFPEFKNAKIWRKEGIDILNKEIKKQVFRDGYQYELSPNYHVGCIEIFLKALRMAQLCGIENEFPKSYVSTVERMIMANMSASYPNGILPMFGDAKLEAWKKMRKNYQRWHKVFPENQAILYMASRRKKGKAPKYLSKALEDAGFY
uniref:Heparin-sulfate lyase N-terminal domain-containing protein n=1 Tax=Setaria digitata TaxID=48799 RepID=A0A915PPZ3_9BILA